MDFELSEDQKLLVETVASFVKKELPMARTRALRDDDIGHSPEVWRQMGELGWLAAAFPEDAGGFGGSFVEAALILEQLGQNLVPEPFIPSVVLGGLPLSWAGTDAQRARYLAPMLAGETTLALAHAELGSRHDVTAIETRAERSGPGYRIAGKKRFVLGGHAADAILVTARTGGGPGDESGVSLFVLDRDTAGLHIQPVKTMDGRRAAMLDIDAVVPAENLVGPEGKAAPLLERTLDHGAAAACAEGYGIMRTVVAMTVDYLKTREQFGQPIGAFQVLQHRAVDMFIETELARSMSILASLQVGASDADERRQAISAAKVQLADSGSFVTQQAIQLHGGIGVTDEHDVGLYFKRMHVLNALFGDRQHHLERLTALPSFRHAV